MSVCEPKCENTKCKFNLTVDVYEHGDPNRSPVHCCGIEKKDVAGCPGYPADKPKE